MPWNATIARMAGPALAQTSPDNRGSHLAFVIGDPADPADRLTGVSALKLRELREIRNAARASLAEIVERQSAQQQARFEAERTLARIIREHNLVPNSEHPALVQLRSRSARAVRELENLQPFYESRAAVAAAVGGLLSNIERWLADLPWTQLTSSRMMRARHAWLNSPAKFWTSSEQRKLRSKAAELSGLNIYRRRDADVRAVLGIDPQRGRAPPQPTGMTADIIAAGKKSRGEV